MSCCGVHKGWFERGYLQLGRGEGTKTDEYSEKFQGGGVIFNLKIYIADFGPLYRALKVFF